MSSTSMIPVIGFGAPDSPSSNNTTALGQHGRIVVGATMMSIVLSVLCSALFGVYLLYDEAVVTFDPADVNSVNLGYLYI